MKRLFSLLFILIVFSFFGFKVPKYKGYVNDYVGILDDKTKIKLEMLCKDMADKGIAEYAIVIIDTTEGAGEFEYAQKLFDEWKIGKKGVDNGILLLVAMKDRRVRIHTGYGVEAIITDGVAGNIIDTYILPYFKQGKFNEGILYGSIAIAKELDTKGQLGGISQKNGKKTKKETLDFLINIIFLVLFLTIILSRFQRGRRSRYYGGGYYGGFGGFGGGGFGGFGGGASGGGGASRGW
jgi:uncharacterized protein